VSARDTLWNLMDAMNAQVDVGCAQCGEAEFSPCVEAFETFDRLLCDACSDAAFEAQADAEEADDRRRANPLEPDYRRMDR
jgi:hypothetical protein